MGLSVWLKTKPSLLCWTVLYAWCPGDLPVLDAAGRTKIWAIHMDEESRPEFHCMRRAWVASVLWTCREGFATAPRWEPAAWPHLPSPPQPTWICLCRPASRKESEEIRSGGGEIILKKSNIEVSCCTKARKHMQDDLKRQVFICREIQHLPAARLHGGPKRQ